MTISEIINTPWVISIPVEHTTVNYNNIQEVLRHLEEHTKKKDYDLLPGFTIRWMKVWCFGPSEVHLTPQSYRFLIVPLPLYS